MELDLTADAEKMIDEKVTKSENQLALFLKPI
jgi:hypothetical protein